MKKLLFLFSLFIFNYSFSQAPANDNCASPQVVIIPVSGTICINSTTVNSTTDLTLFSCETGGDLDVWFTYIATGVQNVITITPNGATPAQFVTAACTNTPCAAASINICNSSATAGGAATLNYSYTVGTQVWVNVSTNGAAGTFQLCITSTTPPPTPGSDCATATILCNKNNFTQDPLPNNINGLLPSCFLVNVQQPVFYRFTVGVTGTCVWSAAPTGIAEYDWAMYNITGGCPGFEVGCNYNYSGGLGSPVGMAVGSPTICPISTLGTPADEFCPPIVVTAGQTYVIMIDNFDFNSVGFNFTWGGTFQMAPTAAFTVAPNNACNAVVSTITNTSAAATTYLWNFGDGGATSGAANPAPHFYGTPGTYLISLTTTSASGCTNTTSQSVTVNPTPSMVAPANISTCKGSNVPASAFNSVPSGATFSWTNSNTTIGLAANGTGNTPSFTANNLTLNPITANITVTPALNGCPGTSVVYTITVNPTATMNAVANVTVCAGSNVPLTTYSSTYPAAVFNWTNSNTAIGLAASGTGQIPAFASTNATGAAIVSTITVTPTMGPCPGTPINYTITVNPLPTVSVAGANQTVCGPSATMAGNVPTSGTGTWTVVSGSGTITTPTSATTGLTALGVGANVFQWTISNGLCPNSSSQVTITSVAVPPIATAGVDQSICGTTATLAGNNAAPGAGIWTLVSGAATITTPASATSGITALGVGANVLQWTITNAPCPATNDQVTITGTAVPTVAAAGPDQSICGNTATLAGNVAAVGVGTWTLVSGSGTITNPALQNTGLTGLGLGANVFQWTIANAPCPSTSDNVTITATFPPTVSNAGPDFAVCGTTATLAANVAAVGTGVWTLISGTGVFTTPNSPTTNVTGMAFGPNVFQWTITTSAPCVPSSDQVTVIATQIPTVANAGPDQLLCGTNTTLAANTPVIGTGTWTMVFGGGVFSNLNIPNPTVTGLLPGANIFQWTISNNPCPASSDQITVTVIAPPDVSNAGPNTSICGNSFTMVANTPSVGIGVWTLVSGSGTITNTGLATTTVTGLGTGPNVFQWTITNLICPISSSQVTITAVTAPTVATAGADQNACGTTATLAGNLAVSGTGTWTLVSGTATITNSALNNSGVTGLGVGANVFQWTIANAPCPATSDQITITATTPPTVANAGPDQTICGTTATMAGNVVVVGTGVWTLVSGGGTITNPNSPTTGITALAPGTNVFQWTITNAPCPPSTDQITIIAAGVPTIANAGPDQITCGPLDTLQGNIALVGTGTWTLISGTGTISAPNNPLSPLSGLGVGANVFQWTIGNAPCPTTSDQVTITTTPIPVIADAGNDTTVCGSTVILNGNPPAPGVGTWTVISGTGVFANPNLYNTSVTGLTVGANTFQWTITNPPCPNTFDNVVITSTGIPTVALAGPDQTVCGPTATMAGNVPLIGTGTWTLISGAGTISNPSSATSGLTALGVGANVFQWTIGNAPCPVTSDQVTITSTPTPPPANAGPTQNICGGGGTATLAGNAAAPGVGTWTLISGTGTITNPNLENTTVTGLGVGANVFQWTIDNLPCPQTTSQVTINYGLAITIAAAGPDQTVCGTTATLAGNTAVSGTGIWTLISGSGTITNPNLETSGITALGVGANVFQWAISGAPCPTTTDQVTITGVSAPTAAVAGPAQNICGTTATLAGNVAAIGTGTWTLVSGSGTITTPSSPTSTLTGLGVGANVFQWTITNAPCPATSDQVTITANPSQSSAFSYGSAVYCQTGANAIPAITGVAGGTFSSAPAGLIFVSTATGEINVLTTPVNNYTITYTTPGPCPTSTNVAVQIVAGLSAGFSYAGPYCTGGANPTPTLNVGASAGTFSAVPAGLVFVSAITGQINLTASVAGVYTVTNSVAATGGCAAVTANANVTINTTPVLVITNPAAVCSPATVDITLAAVTAGSTGAGVLTYWTNATATTSLVTPSSVATSGTYYIKSTNAGCSSVSPVTVTINPTPNLVITNPANVCAPATANITLPAVTAGSSGGGALTYWTNVTATTSLTNPSSISVSGTYYILSSVGTCTDIAPVAVTVNPAPVPAFSGVNLLGCPPLCVTFTDGSTISSGTVNSWHWNFGNGDTSNVQNPVYCYTTSGSYSITLTSTSNTGCTATTSQSNMINVFNVPNASFSAPGVVSIDNPLIHFDDNSIGGLTYNWNFGDMFNTASNTSTLQNPTHTYAVVGTYCIVEVVGNGFCYDTSKLCLVIAPQFTLYIPNAFSPNGDGVNDEFFAKGENITEFSMKIYDRWGNLLFKSDDINWHWDGKYGGHIVEEDVYVYQINLKDNLHAGHKYIGSVTIVK